MELAYPNVSVNETRNTELVDQLLGQSLAPSPPLKHVFFSTDFQKHVHALWNYIVDPKYCSEQQYIWDKLQGILADQIHEYTEAFRYT